MQIKSIIDRHSELLEKKAAPGPIVLSSRIRLARNISGHPFPGWAKEAQRKDILNQCHEAILDVPEMGKGAFVEAEPLSELEKQVLVERHLISRELSSHSQGAGVVLNEEQSCAIMVNEEDHLRIQVVRNSFNLKRIWKQIDAIDTALDDRLDLAFSKDLGYLTACPTNLGTGMRASVMMHLPALVIASQMEKVIRAVNQLGIAVRGLFGEGSDASGNIFQISNQQTLGESEEEILKRLSSVLKSIIEQEENARMKIFENEPEKLFDKIGRAYGTLQNGHLLSSAEAMNYLSLIRLASDMQFLPESARSLVDRLFIESQPGHIQFGEKREIRSDRRDIGRAQLLRDRLQNLPPLNFESFPNQ